MVQEPCRHPTRRERPSMRRKGETYRLHAVGVHPATATARICATTISGAL